MCDRETVNGITTTTCSWESPAGLVFDHVYSDNRHTVGYGLWLEGTWTLTNTSDIDYTHQFRITIPLYYTPLTPNNLVNACYEIYDHSIVVLLDVAIPAGQTIQYDWSASAGFADENSGADFNGDYIVDSEDLGALYANWGVAGGGTVYDLNMDGVVDAEDLGILLAAWSDTHG